MSLYLREVDVEALVSPVDALEAVEGCLTRLARQVVASPPRAALRLAGGLMVAAAVADPELGVAGARLQASFRGGGGCELLILLAADRPEVLAVVEAGRLTELCAGAESAAAARRLARPGARTLGVIGCGRQAAAQIEALRAALPDVGRVVAYCRTAERLAAFCDRLGAEAAGSGREAAAQDVVVTATSSRDPVLRGDWLLPGALVCAVGAVRPEARELDNRVLERAAFVCCDSLAHARDEAGDLIEPVQRGVLDWLEVHEFAQVAVGETEGRQRDDDVVLFKSVGIPAADLAVAGLALRRARERGLGTELAEIA